MHACNIAARAEDTVENIQALVYKPDRFFLQFAAPLCECKA